MTVDESSSPWVYMLFFYFVGHPYTQPARQAAEFSHSAFSTYLCDSLQGSSGFQMNMVCPPLIAETEIGKIRLKS